MPEELKELIEKIQEEGVKAAEDKARDIEEKARRLAEDIINNARKEAANALEEASQKAVMTEQSARASLKQAARDVIILLKKEIGAMLDKVVASHVHRALEPGELAGIILELVKDRSKSAVEDIVISLKKEDLEKLEKGFLSELRGKIKEGVVLKSSDDIHGGFMISYDSGKSYYDFTDKALTNYISFYLKPKLAEILNGTSL